MLRLFDYPRSSAAYRVRLALALKGVDYERTEVHLLRDGGDQHGEAYRKINPQGLVPALEVDGRVLTQSMAIIEFLEENYPSPPLLPADTFAKAHVRALAAIVACDIHPIQNLRVGTYLRQHLGQNDEGVLSWNRHWIEIGLAAFQALLERGPSGRYSAGDTVTLADITLVPQLANARRYGCDLVPLARLVAIDEALRALPPFIAAAPEAFTKPA